MRICETSSYQKSLVMLKRIVLWVLFKVQMLEDAEKMGDAIIQCIRKVKIKKD